MTRCDVTYLLPLRSRADLSHSELSSYLEWLSGIAAEVVVVDGSDPDVFGKHHAAWGAFVRHLAPDPGTHCLNGKVSGVLTGLRVAGEDKFVIADDDVRYDERSLRRVAKLLDDADLVRPQNYFDPLPWHARWDSARSLLNRSFGADYPGTLGVRTSLLRKAGGYDGDVMFENLELMRTVQAVGGSSVAPLDIYVRRLPPETSHFVGQRVRQAYDEFALPGRMCLFLSVVPLVGRALVRRRYGGVLLSSLGLVSMAEVGRRRAGGTAVFPASTPLFAPIWVLERGVCMWLAVLRRFVSGGVPYRDGVIKRAANSPRRLKSMLAERSLVERS